MTNMAAAGMYGGFSLLAFTLIMGLVFLFVYRKLSAKVTVMEVL